MPKLHARWVLTMDSESMSWTALGESRQQCVAALYARWDQRARNINRDPHAGRMETARQFHRTHGTPLEEYYGAHIVELVPGVCITDEDETTIKDRQAMRERVAAQRRARARRTTTTNGRSI
jgi:hypothetical protein